MKNKGRRGKRGKNRKVLYAAGGCVAVLLVLYLGVSFYFNSHFLPNTEINGHDLSGRTEAQGEDMFRGDVDTYELVLTELNDVTETISGEEISLTYEDGSELGEALESQNSFLWPAAFFRKSGETVNVGVAYDEQKLQEKINSLQAVTGEQTQPVSAHPQFDGTQFVVEPEQYGTAVDMEALQQKIAESVSGLAPELDLEEEGCYALPAYTSDSPEVQQACDQMNQYCQARIVYTMSEDVTIDASVISGWLTTDDQMQAVIDENAVRAWLEEFGNTYDTVGTTRTFTTPAGKAATVTGGTYGWSINEDTEFDVIINAIKNGENLTREPEYYIGGTAATHDMPDWGNTYIDVDLSAQHMWYVVDGSVALETDVVTGEPIPEKITPEGTYTILEKGLDEVLVGATDPATGQPSYRTPVNYWMRVTWEGVGFHDATWQSAFGGTRNQIPGVGSHGCINMPLDQAAALYDMVEVGTPVVMHY